MTHATAAYAVSGLPFTVDETVAAGLQQSDSFSADELSGKYVGTYQQPAPEVMTAEFVIRWGRYVSNGTTVTSLLNADDAYGYGLTAKVTVEQSRGPAPQHGALRGTLALYASPYPTPIGSPHPVDDDLLICTSDFLSEIPEAPLNLPAPSVSVAYLRFGAVSLTARGEMYWPAPKPFYAAMELDLDIPSSSTEHGVLQGSATLYFVSSR